MRSKQRPGSTAQVATSGFAFPRSTFDSVETVVGRQGIEPWTCRAANILADSPETRETDKASERTFEVMRIADPLGSLTELQGHCLSTNNISLCMYSQKSVRNPSTACRCAMATIGQYFVWRSSSR
jgi:hypothetical protein